MTDTTTTLTVEQQQRAEALSEARDAITSKGFAGSSAANPADLVSVAEWILTGNDPWIDDAPKAEPYTFDDTIRITGGGTAGRGAVTYNDSGDLSLIHI